MPPRRDLEIYVRGLPIPDLLGWVRARVGDLEGPERAGEASVWRCAAGAVTVTPGIDGDFVSFYLHRRSRADDPFTGAGWPWRTDLACARDLAARGACVVRCDPGGGDASDVFLELAGSGERRIQWG